MRQRVVLPRFEVPSNRPHGVILAAWVTGGLLLFSVAGLAVVIMHHRTLETRARIAEVQAMARIATEAEARLAAAAAARVARDAEHSARTEARSATATTVPTAGSGGFVSGDIKPTKTGHVHRAHPSQGSNGSKMAAKSGTKLDAVDELLRTKSSKPAAKSGAKLDAVDELLKTKSSRMAAKSSAKTESAGPSSSGKPDAIEELLKRMK